LFKKILIIFIAILTLPTQGESLSLRILTVNVWSGLDYQGTLRFGQYESTERRERRFNSLVQEINKLNPDIIFIQEANPIDRYLPRLADRLSMEEIHQVCNEGIKLYTIGIPENFKEGIAILARPSLGLNRWDTWKLSGSPGIFGDLITVHFDESVFALVGKITLPETPFIL
jgi:hypothetical protein